jgi:hypothetical protein
MNDDFVALVSRFGTEHYCKFSTTNNNFGERALWRWQGLRTSKYGKSSSRRIQQRVSLESTLPLLLEGFRKNTNLVKVADG